MINRRALLAIECDHNPITTAQNLAPNVTSAGIVEEESEGAVHLYLSQCCHPLFSQYSNLNDSVCLHVRTNRK